MDTNKQITELFNNFIKKPGAEKKATLHACQVLSINPPSDYLAALQFTNRGESFIRYSFFRLYSIYVSSPTLDA